MFKTWLSYKWRALSFHAVLTLMALFCTASPASGQKPDFALEESVWAREQELLKSIEKKGEREKYDTYMQLALLFKDSPRELAYLDLMEKTARGLKSSDLIAAAMLMRLEFLSICNDSGEFLDYAETAGRYMKGCNDDRAANVRFLVIRRHIEEGRNQTAYKAAKEMLEHALTARNQYMEAYAYMSIGFAYSAGHRFKEAYEALKESILIMDRIDSRIPEPDRILAGMELAEAAYGAAEYDLSIESSNRTLSLLDKYMSDNSTEENRKVNYRSRHLYVLCCLARNHVMLGNIRQAKTCLDRAAADIYPEIGLDGEFYNETCAIYYMATGQYDTALKHADESVASFSGQDLLPYYLDALRLKTDILAKKGKWEEAYSNMKFIERQRDSINVDQFAMQMNELHTLYEVDKIKAEKDRQRLLILFIGTGCLLLMVIAIICIVYSYRLNSKNKFLYRQIQENIFKEDKANLTLQMTEDAQLSKEMKLFRSVAGMMEEKRPFTDPEFGRLAMVKSLCTNEKYLADAIREGAGVTIAAYISDCRLAYSLKLLADNPDLSIEEIAAKSGHNAYSSFFRAFSRKYSMSPSEYRKMLRNGHRH